MKRKNSRKNAYNDLVSNSWDSEAQQIIRECLAYNLRNLKSQMTLKISIGEFRNSNWCLFWIQDFRFFRFEHE